MKRVLLLALVLGLLISPTCFALQVGNENAQERSATPENSGVHFVGETDFYATAFHGDVVEVFSTPQGERKITYSDGTTIVILDHGAGWNELNP